MKKINHHLPTAMVMLFILIFPLAAAADGPVEWGYQDPIGPNHWADLSAEFLLCARGKNQSPVDLNNFFDSQLETVTFKSSSTNVTIHNNGHTIQVNVEPGNTVTAGEQVYELKQFHFHSPSEHTVEGRSFPMEVHLVHQNSNGDILVIAVLLDKGRTNRTIKELWRRMPDHEGEENSLRRIDVYQILPQTHEYYRYNGSLTTPPCTEGVRWMVMKEIGEVSRRQTDTFMRVMEQPNNRPVQLLNARPILR